MGAATQKLFTIPWAAHTPRPSPASWWGCNGRNREVRKDNTEGGKGPYDVSGQLLLVGALHLHLPLSLKCFQMDTIFQKGSEYGKGGVKDTIWFICT